jgi:eukaryotic-like serine/threonine-protein kinase
MALTAGARLGPYEIIGLLGAGGMGEVYRARDTRLDRDVAIKVLPESFARDHDRLRRFEQEARAVAVLNDPNILAVYDVGQHDGAPYLVTELLEGESLRSVLRTGTLGERRGLDYAVQIAHGLAAAHEKGLVHRDLKPENLFVTHSGRIKILDFGVAKLAAPEAQSGSESASVATLTRVGTASGVAVGTPAYMSPEQLRGLPVDGRSDIFSFGLVLCELFSGRHPFQRPTSVETMNAILTAEPFAGESAGGVLPQGVQLIVSHCLEKDPHHRFQAAQDVAFNLNALSGSSRSIGAVEARTSSARSRWWSRIRLATEALLVLSLTAAVFLVRRPDVQPAPVSAAILPPPGEGFWANSTQPAAISPDGRFLAVVSMQNGLQQLWLRRMDSPDAHLIVGSAGATNPFWSPDSKFVGFFTKDRLKKLDPSGGIVSDVCPIESLAFGGAWSARGVIVFGILGHALRQVADTGGVPEAIPGMALSSNTLGQYWPVFLPDGQRFLYLEWAYPPGSDNAIWAASLDGGTPKRLALKASSVAYSAGYLLFSRDADLFAQKFNLDRLELSGTALPVARQIQYDTFVQSAAVTVSETGVLVYAPAGTGVNSELTWMDRNGRSVGVLDEPRQFMTQTISPDAARVAVSVKKTIHHDRIWIYDVARGSRIPISSTVYSAYGPVWSPDGKWIAYRSLAGKSSAIRIHASDGSGEERQVGRDSSDIVTPTAWSPDGRYLVVDSWPAWTRGVPNTIQVWPVTGDSKPVFTIEDASGGQLSPDGRWLAYYRESEDQLYVTSFPHPGPRVAIAAGGSDPRWRADGQELYFVAGDHTLIAAQVRAADRAFKVISSHPLFRPSLSYDASFYDVTADGQRFLVNVRTPRQQSAPLMVITDWRARLRDPRGREVAGAGLHMPSRSE